MDNVRTEYRLGSVLFSPGELNFETPLAANGFTAFCWCLWCLSWSINSEAVNDNVSKKSFSSGMHFIYVFLDLQYLFNPFCHNNCLKKWVDYLCFCMNLTRVFFSSISFFLSRKKQIDMLGWHNTLGTLNIEMDFPCLLILMIYLKNMMYCITPRKLWKYTHNLKYTVCLIRKYSV